MERRTALTIGLVSAGLGVAYAGHSILSSDERSCPEVRTELIPGDDSPAVTDKSTSWRKGVDLSVTLPEDARGMIVGWSSDREKWHYSRQIPEEKANDATRKLRVAYKLGNGPLAVSAKIVAPDGSAACDAPPKYTKHVVPSFNKLVESGALDPGKYPGWQPENL